jgi:hypothetical protein
MLTSDVGVQGQFDDIRSAAEEVVGQIAVVLCDAVGRMDAANVLSQPEGFGRFSRSCLRVEPTAAIATFGLGRVDVSAELAEPFPTSDKAGAARWAKQWSRGWERRFERA